MDRGSKSRSCLSIQCLCVFCLLLTCCIYIVLQYHEKQKEAHWDLTLRHLDTLDVVRQRV